MVVVVEHAVLDARQGEDCRDSPDARARLTTDRV